MHCPACGYENLIGAESCDNCGGELAGHDLPQPALAFRSALLSERLGALGAPPPIVVAPDAGLEAVITTMQEAGSDCVLVMSGDDLVGIFTDRDAVVKAAGKRLDRSTVSDYMTEDPVVLRDDDPLAVAIHKMAVGGFRHIPILDDGRPVGVVTAREIFRLLSEGLD